MSSQNRSKLNNVKKLNRIFFLILCHEMTKHISATHSRGKLFAEVIIQMQILCFERKTFWAASSKIWVFRATITVGKVSKCSSLQETQFAFALPSFLEQPFDTLGNKLIRPDGGIGSVSTGRQMAQSFTLNRRTRERHRPPRRTLGKEASQGHSRVEMRVFTATVKSSTGGLVKGRPMWCQSFVIKTSNWWLELINNSP